MFRKFILSNITKQYVRSFGKHNKKFLYKDGKHYEGIIYYPRNPDHVDPDIEPAKLFRVERIKPIKGCPFWERRILKDLGIHEKMHDPTVVKNIPENNARLWKIKHLIKVTPINFVYGEPTDQDVNYTVLKENGDCLVTKTLKIDEERLIASKDYETNPAKLDGETLRRDSRLKWLNNWS